MPANTCTAPRHTGGSARVGSLCQGLAPHVATPLISLDIWSESFVSDVTTLCSQILRLRNTRTTRIESKPVKQNTVWDWYYNSFDLEPEPTSVPASVWLMLIIHFWDADLFFYCATNINGNECRTSVDILYCDGVNTYVGRGRIPHTWLDLSKPISLAYVLERMARKGRDGVVVGPIGASRY